MTGKVNQFKFLLSVKAACKAVILLTTSLLTMWVAYFNIWITQKIPKGNLKSQSCKRIKISQHINSDYESSTFSLIPFQIWNKCCFERFKDFIKSDVSHN